MAALVPDDTIGKVITSVQQHPILWQMGLDAYKRGDLKENAWSTISTELKIDVKCVREIWTKARTKFNKLKNDYEFATRSGAAGVPEPSWTFYKDMKFLIGHGRNIKKRATHSNMQLDEIVAQVQQSKHAVQSTSAATPRVATALPVTSMFSQDSPEQVEIYMDSAPLVVSKEVAEYLETEYPEGSSTVESAMDVIESTEVKQENLSQIKRKRASDDRLEQEQFLSGIAKIVSQIPRPQTVETNLHPDVTFGNFIAATLMNLDEEETILKKRLITQVLFD